MTDSRAPVIVGVGQVTNRRQRLVDAMTLIEESALMADADAGGGALERVRSVQVVSVVSRRYSASATTLADRLGLQPGERLSTTVGGSTPLTLLAGACDRIARGDIDAVLIAGGEALDSARRASKEGVTIDRGHETKVEEGIVGDDRSPLHEVELRSGLAAPATIYPMFEQALAHRAGRSVGEQRAWLGETMSPFTVMAASHLDLAWFPRILKPADISSVTADNRMVAEPYTKNLNAIIQVDMAASLIVMSAEAAEAAGIAADKWIFPWSVAKCDDVYLTVQRPDLTRAIGITAAATAAFHDSAIGIDDVDHLDLYSCFPSAVQMGAEALGIEVDDARGLTVTGGLPFFGGPGNNYVTHSIACMVERLRGTEYHIGLCTGISWYMSKHAVGLFSAKPPPNRWRFADTTEAQRQIDSTAMEVAEDAEGIAVVDAFTVEHDRETGPVRAPIYATLEDGRRIAAAPADAQIPKELSGRSIVGEKVRVRTGDGGTRYELS